MRKVIVVEKLKVASNYMFWFSEVTGGQAILYPGLWRKMFFESHFDWIARKVLMDYYYSVWVFRSGNYFDHPTCN